MGIRRDTPGPLTGVFRADTRMIPFFINTVASLLVGVISGFFFERRATQAARAYSDQLEQELSYLRHSVLSVGGSPKDAGRHEDSDIESLILRYANSIQDVEGRVRKSAIMTHFTALGHSSQTINSAIEMLYTSGSAREAGQWITLL